MISPPSPTPTPPNSPPTDSVVLPLLRNGERPSAEGVMRHFQITGRAQGEGA